MEVVWDMNWIFDNTSIKKGDTLSFKGLDGEFKIVNSNSILLGSLFDFENKLPRTLQSAENLTHEYKFDDAFMCIPNYEYPPLKLKGIRYKYDIFVVNTKSLIKYKIMAKAVLKDIVTGDIHLHKKTSEIEITHDL
jgi:hypothetical protein